ncbi:Rv3654c family TadE-like protein [Allonocardiopsis opalescens]|uniref:Secretion/DNA translocation related TadE-like protein n=1 Tax=Allonocardiopsis opalescens TaxID=1144618 RepID=A0A2T0Q6K0_9ACTN|nr:Rv3654c family TadE-like protein [Allonocardiopsis opalescens]PRX99469.1 secretion/DNA translocation related TadE-like protein [Allonocardiopsis opalescens]
MRCPPRPPTEQPRRPSAGLRAQRGSGTVWAVALCALVWTSALVLAAAAGVRADRQQAAGAADLAALAAAARAVAGASAACAAADASAQRNGARLESCAVRGPAAEVVVAVPVDRLPAALGIGPDLQARSRAGPVGWTP